MHSFEPIQCCLLSLGADMKRREFITLLGATAATWPLAAGAQQPTARVYRIGCQSVASRETSFPFIKAFEEGLRSLGYRVGENVVIEYRFAPARSNCCLHSQQTLSGSVWTSLSPS